MSISRSTWIFLAVGLLLQVLTFSLMPATPLSLLSGMLGVAALGNEIPLYGQSGF